MVSQAPVAKLDIPQPEDDLRRRSHWQRAYYHLRQDGITLVALFVLFVLVVMALSAPIFEKVIGITYDAENLNYDFLAPGSEAVWKVKGGEIRTIKHILGTDEQGRDVFIRLLYGAQVSLGIAVIASSLSMTIGVSLGMITGFIGGVVDDFFIWLITTINSIPQLFLLLIISALLRPGPFSLILVLGFLGWTGIMRLVRGESLSLREREYIVAARAMGASNRRLMFQHIFPNLISIVVIIMALDIGALILAESGLSFLGFGIQPPIPSWGNMLTNSQQYFRKAPYLVVLPGLMISTTVL
ncbi:hypothetical protein MASR2M15_08450 [Anaerolineales bacterium]